MRKYNIMRCRRPGRVASRVYNSPGGGVVLVVRGRGSLPLLTIKKNLVRSCASRAVSRAFAARLLRAMRDCINGVGDFAQKPLTVKGKK